MRHLGDYPTSATVDLKWTSTALNGASITRGTDGSIRIYKNNSDTQRSSSAGITDTEDFDSLTGVHHLRIDLSDNTDASFYAAGNEYQVVLVGAVIDGVTVNTVLAEFSIERSGGVLALLKANRSEPAQGAPGVSISVLSKIDYLYKAFRNRMTQTASEGKLYADDATTVDHKWSFSDNGTTADRGEVATGP